MYRRLSRTETCVVANRRQSLAQIAIDEGSKLGAMAGFVVGLLAAVDVGPATPASCTGTTPADQAAQCFGDSLVGTLKPYLISVGGGVLLGAIAGLLVARFGVLAVRLIASTARSRPNAAQPVTVNGPTARRMTARYSGTCVDCRTSIRPGDQIQHRGPRQTRCAQCATAP